MTNIKLIIRSFPIANEFMSLAVLVNGELLLKNQTVVDRLDLVFDTNLPVKIEFQTSGKNQSDTKIDSLGNLTCDKHILVEGICIDGIWMKKWIIESRLFRPTGSNYFGQNGSYYLEIPYSDIMDFWLETLLTD